jgi:signal transduction histidine kinase
VSFANPQKVAFRYKLEGRDNTWEDAGTRRQAFYTDLSPGHYRFRVIASNSDGVWNETGATLIFSIAPAWYQTAWFRAFCTVAFLGSLWALYRLRFWQLHQKFAIALEARVSERTRIARHLHDTLLQSLQGLVLRFQSASNLLPARAEEAKERLDAAIAQAASAITEGRDAVRELRSETVMNNDLSHAISLLGKELAADRLDQERPEFSVHLEGTPRSLHPILRDEVYRIATEALRNAFKHGRARRIEVELRYDERQLRLRIRDDGKGFNPQARSENRLVGHWGLSGMRERAKLVGGRLELWTELESGTEAELSVPASVAYATSSVRGQDFF